jgi:hypothetical protein
VPKPQVTTLLKEYIQRRQLTYPFDRREFLDVFIRAGDRELAEWIFQSVAESRPTIQVSDYPDIVPTLRPVNISDLKSTRVIKRSENISDRYLEPIFPYMGIESIPLLLEHLDSDNEELRAFIVWRLTSLGYEWSDEKIQMLQKDSDWRICVNALFAVDVEDLAEALNDESAIVRIIAHLRMQAQRSAAGIR